jgi:hypothetical protein
MLLKLSESFISLLVGHGQLDEIFRHATVNRSREEEGRSEVKRYKQQQAARSGKVGLDRIDTVGDVVTF